MLASCSYGAKLAHKVAQEQILKERELERKYNMPIKDMKKMARKRKQDKLAQQRREQQLQREQKLREQQQQREQKQRQQREQHQQQQQQQRRSYYSFISRLMREQDAELLEQNENQSQTSSHNSNKKTKGSSAAVGGSSISGSVTSATPSTKPKKEKKKGRNRSSSLGAFKESFRMLLSGEVFSSIGKRQSSKADNLHQLAAAAGEESSLISSAISAEKRRMNETVQFAKAVGEVTLPPLIIIDNDNGSDDTDDDDASSCFSGSEISVPTQEIHIDIPTQLSSTGRNSSRMPTSLKTAIFPNHMMLLPTPENSNGVSTAAATGSSNNSSFMNGICQASLRQITKRGYNRGNYVQIHRKAWLEVSDLHHRYGKNLRLYYRHWEKMDCPTNSFFDWLDSKGEAAGQSLPNLEECPRSTLDCDTVLYITNPMVTESYALDVVVNNVGCVGRSSSNGGGNEMDSVIGEGSDHCEDAYDGRGRIMDVDGKPVVTGKEGWIFVIRDNRLYGGPKITSISGHSKKRFHHSSFFGGKAVSSAGIIITDSEGYLTCLLPHSGHYRPRESDMQRCLFFLHSQGVDLRSFDMDTQQIRHVARDNAANKSNADGLVANEADDDRTTDQQQLYQSTSNKKMKKVESIHLEMAMLVACFLAHKASLIGNGVFSCIQQISESDVTTVSEALKVVDDNGGYWNRSRRMLAL